MLYLLAFFLIEYGWPACVEAVWLHKSETDGIPPVRVTSGLA